MPSFDQRVCNCKHHAEGNEDCGGCCNYVAQVERDEAVAVLKQLAGAAEGLHRSVEILFKARGEPGCNAEECLVAKALTAVKSLVKEKR